MKKLLSVFAAAAMLFSFASCSGDLHDDVYKVIDLSGGAVPGDWASPANWDNTTAWTTVDKASNTYTFDFETKADLDGDVGFKIVTVSGEWNVDGYTEFKVPVDGSVTAEMKTGAAMGGAGNAFVTGCKAGGKYTMTVVSNPDTTITVSVVASEGGAAPAAPVPYVLSGMFVRGVMFDASWGAVLDGALLEFTTDKDGNVIYKKDFTATAANQEFKIASADWANGWGGTAFVLNDDYVKFEEKRVDGGTDTNNAALAGLSVGSSYRLYIKTTPEKEVFAKVVSLANITVSGATVTASGLPEALNGTTLYFTGDFNGWKAPGDPATIEATVAAGSISVVLPDFSKEFEGSEAQEFVVEGKFANTGWTRPEVCSADGNIKFTITPAKKALVGTFTSENEHDEGGVLYICDWVVE